MTVTSSDPSARPATSASGPDTAAPGAPRPDRPAPAGGSRIHLLGHNAAFDGLRGVAVVLVMLYHFRPFGLAPGGWMGVDLFFALSGFLITALLLSEMALEGRVRLVRFHVRRALRLQPALWFFLGGWLVALLLLGGHYWFATVPGFPVGHGPPVRLSVALTGVLSMLAKVNNWLTMSHVPMPPIGHLWSLSIEEQFYLVWPVALLLVVRYRPQWMLRTTVGLAAASAVACPLFWHGGRGGDHVYFGTDTRAQALLLGAAAAQLWAAGRLDHLGGSRRGRAAFLASAATLVGVAALAVDRAPFRNIGGFTLIDLASAVVVAGLAVGVSRRAHRLLSWPPIVWMGRRSYAIYLWNYVFATWFHPLGTVGIIPGTVASLAAAELSWRLVERRALRLKSRFGRGTAPVAAAAPPRSPAAVHAG